MAISSSSSIVTRIRVLTLCLFLLFPFAVRAAGKAIKDSFVSGGKTRTVYLVLPDGLKAPQPVPLIVMFHGSGHNGLSLADKWKDIANKEGFIVAAPDSADPAVWSTTADGPDVLRDLIEQLKLRYSINSRQVYLFGHSGGAVFALLMSMYESEYFAAAAVHAGAWRKPREYVAMNVAKRKIPIAIWVGTNDQFFPLLAVRATREALKGQGFPVEVTEIPGHDHWYYDIAPQINKSAWEFLKKYELPAEQHYAEYGDASDAARLNRLIHETDALRKRADELRRQAQDGDAEIQKLDLTRNRAEISAIVAKELELLKQSAAMWLEAAAKADSAKELRLDERPRLYLSLIAQHNRKNAELVNALREQVEILLGEASAEVTQAKWNEAGKKVVKLQQEADELLKQMEKVAN